MTRPVKLLVWSVVFTGASLLFAFQERKELLFYEKNSLIESLAFKNDQYNLAFLRGEVHLNYTGAESPYILKPKGALSVQPTLRGSKLAYDEIFPGINWVFYEKETGNIGYDFIIKPGANPSAICLPLNEEVIEQGAKPLRKTKILLNGDLLIPTKTGEIRHTRPYAFQEIDGERMEVESSFLLENECLSFKVKEYNELYDLIIDPEIRVEPSGKKLTIDKKPTLFHDHESRNLIASNPSIISEGVLMNFDNGLDPNAICVDVFDDLNVNGINDNETGISNVTVTAYDADNNPTVLTNNNDGSYTFTPGNDDTYRVEVSDIPSNLEPSIAGSTTVFFMSRGERVEVGLIDPLNANPTDLFLVTPCYVDGSSNGSNANGEVLVIVPEIDLTSGNGNVSPTEYFVANHSQIGTTFGVVYSQAANSIFAAAFTKRHAGFGPGGTGAIYKVDLNGNRPSPPISATNVSTFIDLNTLFGSNIAGTDPHPAGSDFNRDPDTYDAVGKVGLGGLAYSERDNVLWTINLADRRLYEMPLGANPSNPIAPTAGDISIWPSTGDLTDLPGLPGSPAERDANVRPFAVSYFEGAIYIGVVYTAESTVVYDVVNNVVTNTGDRSQMQGFIYKFDPNTNAFTQVLDFPFDYVRGQAVDFCFNNGQAEFNPWTPIYDKVTFENAVQGTSGASGTGPNALAPERVYPQPWITDIEFDGNGLMFIGIRDRFADQHGFKKLPPSTIGTDANVIFNADAAGDILMASITSDNINYVLENNSSNGAGGAQFGPTIGANKGEGPGNGEFFFDDRYRPADASSDGNGNCPNGSPDPNDMDPILDPQFEQGHDEVSLGGVYYRGGSIFISAYDPISTFDDFNQAGFIELSTNDGSRLGASMVYASQDFNGATNDDGNTFGKGNGLGDVFGIIGSAPIEVGNRLWLDDNNNGIQDPNEDGINGILVELYKDINGSMTKVAETVTGMDATTGNGAYKFSNSNEQTWMNGETQILPNMNYEIRVTLSNIQTVNVNVTAFTTSGTNTSNNNKTDLNDSDVNSSGVIAFTTGNMGESNHTLDIGVTEMQPICSININSVVAASCEPLTNTYQLTVNVTYANAPMGEMINITTDNGANMSFTLTGTNGTEDFVITGLTSDGIDAIDVAAGFSITTSCTNSSVDAYNAPPSCLCAITALNASVDCSDNSTSTLVDDFYTLTLDPVGNGIGSQYNVVVIHDGMTYNEGPFDYNGIDGATLAQTFLITGGDLSVTVIDATMGTCNLGPEAVVAPASCSTPCSLDPTLVTVCNNNGTNLFSESGDDYFTLLLNVVSANPGTSNSYEVLNNPNMDGTGGTLIGTGIYGEELELGNTDTPPFLANGIVFYSLAIRDINDPTCFVIIEIGPVNSCSNCPGDNCGGTVIRRNRGTGN